MLVLKLKDIRIVPSVILAFSTCIFFYFLLSNLIFVDLFFLVLALVVYFLLQPKFSRKILVFTIFFGFLLASIAYIRLVASKAPIISLAEIKKIEKITFLLYEDARPSGHKYYRAMGKVLKCRYKDGSTYSSKGRAVIFLPTKFVRQNYMGGSISTRGNENLMFCKGIKIEIAGHFQQNKKHVLNNQTFFVSENTNVVFLGWESKLLLYRTRLRFLINRLLYGWEKGGALLLALLTANKDFISLDDLASFRKAGLSHILALSGMHLAVVGLISTYFVSFLVNKKVLKLFLISTSFIFLIFAGASPSLIRAFIMLTIVAIARLLYVKVNLLGVLCFTFSIHLVMFPEDSLTLSFMLSYGALFGILACSNAIFYFLNPFVPDVLNASISASLAATFFTIPIIAFSIKEVSFVSVISTCIVSPLISIFLIVGIIFIALVLIFPSLYEIFGFLLNQFYSFIIYIVDFFAKFPLIKIENYPLSFLPLILGILIIFMYEFRRKKQLENLIF